MSRSLHFYTIFLLLAFVAAAGAQDDSPQTSSVQKAELGNTINVNRVGQLFTAGQFAQADIESLQKNKIETVITLRTDGELNWDEQKLVEDSGMKFINIPVSPATLDDELFDQVRRALKQNQGKTTLMHCKSAGRVGCTWLPYRVLDQNIELESALAEARTIGSKGSMEAKAIEYIKRKLAQRSMQEESVKPGINKSFLDPELDVEKYIERFEVESREIYTSRNAILKGCEISPGDYIADVGAGTGLFTRLFSQAAGASGWVYAVDISPNFLTHINQQTEQAPLKNISGVLCSERDIKLPPNSVDVIFICDTYHHFEYPKSTLASIHRALKPDGQLIVIDFERVPGQTRDWLLNHVRAGKEVFRAEIQDAGFTLAEEKRIEGLKENYFLKFHKSSGN